jgi:protein-L-isoaspartate(D-aspartate) O-methyltransferase
MPESSLPAAPAAQGLAALMVDVERASSLRRQLVEDLVAKGVPLSGGWRSIFERVPRHVFVPRFEVSQWEGPSITADSAVDPDRWLELVYSDTPLVTRTDAQGASISSSSAPRIMAMFLDALDIEHGSSILEIGTATGYNAAILCERVGSENVTTMDIDPGLVDAARDRLEEVGYAPEVVTADGLGGYPPRAPYDRIIATCSIHRIPTAWLDQLRPGGVLVAPLREGSFEAVLVALRKREDGSAVGNLYREPVSFMRLIGNVEPAAPELPTREELQPLVEQGSGVTRPCTIPSWLAAPDMTQYTAALLAKIELPDVVWYWLPSGGEGRRRAIAGRLDRSWARVDLHEATGELSVTQGGPRRLWDLLEESYARWLRLGKPELERFGVTVTADGDQQVWIDSPASEDRWELWRWR